MAGDAPLCACAHCVCGCGDATGGATGAGGSASGGGADAAAAPASGPGPGPGPRPRSTAGSASRAVGNAEGTDARDAGFGVGVRSAVCVASSSTSATAGSDTRLVRVDARAHFSSSAATSSRSSRVSFRSVAVPPRTAVSSTSSRAFIAFRASRICPVYSSRRASAERAASRRESRRRRDAIERDYDDVRSSNVHEASDRARVGGAGGIAVRGRERATFPRVPSISSILLAMASRIASLCAFAPGPIGTAPFPEPGLEALGSESGTAAGLGFAGMGCSRSNGSAASSSPMARGGRSRRRARRRRVCHLRAPNARVIAESEK